MLRTTSPFANSEKRDFGLLCVRTVGVMVVVGDDELNILFSTKTNFERAPQAIFLS